MGRAPSYAQRAATGMRRLEVWVTGRHIEKLDAACEEEGRSRAAHVMGLIDADAAGRTPIATRKKSIKKA